MNHSTILSTDNHGPDGRGMYRYTLWRDVRDLTTPSPQGFAMFIGLNPSTADENEDDPTIRRCKDFAQRLGFGWLLMVNLFAFRATDPRVMKRATSPVGDDNDDYLKFLASAAAAVICAWGKDGTHLNRAAHVAALVRQHAPLFCLRKNKDGSPEHPLYIPAATIPVPWP